MTDIDFTTATHQELAAFCRTFEQVCNDVLNRRADSIEDLQTKVADLDAAIARTTALLDAPNLHRADRNSWHDGLVGLRQVHRQTSRKLSRRQG